jgi:hypothetical protein
VVSVSRASETRRQELVRAYAEQLDALRSGSAWRGFERAANALDRQARSGPLPFDPRFNAALWAYDVIRLCNEMGYSYCWMAAHAELHSRAREQGRVTSDSDVYVGYFADNCVTRIDSCRDKIALMVWAYYCPFNPENKEEVLSYEEIVKRLASPATYALRLRGHADFLAHLRKLRGKSFERVEHYRHLKIHRREPVIALYGVKPHHGWGYMLPLTDPADVRAWKRRLAKLYPDPYLRGTVEQNCYVQGTLYDRRRLRHELWAFDEVRGHIQSCMTALDEASAGCFRVLTRRAPLRRRGRRKPNRGPKVATAHPRAEEVG